MPFYLIILFVVVIDQLSKLWIRMHLKVGDSIEVWRGILDFTHYENSGAAFSSFQGYGRLFIPVAILFVVIILYYRRKGVLKGFAKEMGAAFLAGGAIGNAIDRILFNQVTDFVHFQSGQGILNLADYSINIGIILFVMDMLIFSRFTLFSKRTEG
jgi:signal peptidase II